MLSGQTGPSRGPRKSGPALCREADRERRRYGFLLRALAPPAAPPYSLPGPAGHTRGPDPSPHCPVYRSLVVNQISPRSRGIDRVRSRFFSALLLLPLVWPAAVGAQERAEP